MGRPAANIKSLERREAPFLLEKGKVCEYECECKYKSECKCKCECVNVSISVSMNLRVCLRILSEKKRKKGFPSSTHS